MEVPPSESGSQTNSMRDGPKSHTRRKGFYELVRGDQNVPQAHFDSYPHNVSYIRGFRIKSSKRWLECGPSASGWLPLPHIDRLGKFTGTSQCLWQCAPQQWFATVVATVAKRLCSYARRHNKSYICSRYYAVLSRVAGYYVLTKNCYVMDRILYFLRNLKNRGKLIHPLLLSFVAKLDENKRFVYSQVCYQTNWLLFRATKPRDKSKFVYRKVKTHPIVQWSKGYINRRFTKFEMSRSLEKLALGLP
jgi:hypothetical protein